jgi:hypothetical protein
MASLALAIMIRRWTDSGAPDLPVDANRLA